MYSTNDQLSEGRSQYASAHEQATLDAFHRTIRPLKRVWRTFTGVLGDVGSVGTDFLSILGIVGSRVKDEVTEFVGEIQRFPGVVQQMLRDGDFLRPFEGVNQFFFILGCMKEDFLCNWNYSMRNARISMSSKWGRSYACKVYVGGLLSLIMFTVYHYKIRPWPRHDTTTENRCLHKVVVITGASAGLGYRVAYEFAVRGAFVILTSPDMVKARKARVDLARKLNWVIEFKKQYPSDNTHVRYMNQIQKTYELDVPFILQNIVEMELNLASTASIYSFSRKVQGIAPDGIDFLVNNAAVNIPPEELVVTDEGKEVHFAVNYFGHFILTNLLMNELAKRKGARIINITCKQAAKDGFLNMEEFIEPYLEEEGLPFLPATMGYANSKLAMYLFNRQLAQELLLSNICNVTTYCVCPGYTSSTFINRFISPGFAARLALPFATAFSKSELHAVQTIMYCALSPKCARESGFFYENNKRSTLDTQHANPNETAQVLWTLSRTLMDYGHQPMLKLTEQMHIISHENVFQLSNNLFLQRRDVMTYLLLMEEKQAHKKRHTKYVDERGDARNDFTYYWHGFHLTGGDGSTVMERRLLINAHPGFKELQKEYDIWFECTGSAHYYPKATGKLGILQYMASTPNPLTIDEIEDLEELHQSDDEPDEEMTKLESRYGEYIPMEEFLD